MIRPALGSFVLPVLLLSAVLSAAPAIADDPAADAVRLYDEGRYAEARPLLEQLHAEGAADGPLLYRLYYCQLNARDPQARDTLTAAVARLESDLPGATDLEVPFYLANAYINQGRRADARRVAGEAVARIDSGSIADPTTPIEMFRLGKLYADVDRDDGAERWYRAALDGFAAQGDAAPRPYVEWAAAWLAERAQAAGDDAATVDLYSTLLEGGKGTMDDWDRLAVAQARTGDLAGAERSWRQAEKANPAEANRARYCYRLAAMARELGGLPTALDDGRTIAELSKDDLQQVLGDQVRALGELRDEVAGMKKVKKRQRRKLEARLDAIHRTFTAAALEFALKRYGIREAAFFGGYAPLIFRPREWRLPEPGSATRQPADPPAGD